MIDVPILVKDALRDGRLLKNYRILVLNDDGTTDFVIDNDTLVSETVSIDERMCSGDTIKFGLCEGSSLEFQYFDHPSIYGRQLQVFVDVWSDYAQGADDPIWHDIKVLTETDGTFTVVKPGTYKIDYVGPISFKIEWTRNGVTYHDEIYPMAGADSYPLGDLVAGDTIRAYTDYAFYTFSVDLKGYYAEVSHWYTIPMGFFTVEKCSRQASTGIKKVTAYNKLKSDYLDQKANIIIDESYSNPNDFITLFDITNLLLEDYQIKPDYNDVIISQVLGQASRAKIGTSALSFRATYGVNALLNYYEYYNNSLSQTRPSNSFYLFINSRMFDVSLDISKIYQFIFSDMDIEKFEDDFFNLTLDVITQGINITTTNLITRLMTPTQTSSPVNYDNYVGYQQWVGVMLVYADDSVEYYSKYAFLNGVSNVKGSIRDLARKTFTNVKKIRLYAPGSIILSNSSSTTIDTYYQIVSFFSEDNLTYKYYTDSQLSNYNTEIIPHWCYIDGKSLDVDYYESHLAAREFYGLPPASQIKVEINSIPDFTLRDIQSAIFETQCQFGKLDRVTDLFSGVELNNSSLYPATTLYPDNALYPNGSALSSEKSMYSKLWADEGNIQSWRNLIITYKGLDENNQEKDFTLQRQVNANGTQDYNMSDNWIFKNLVWTAEDVGDYADAMVAKMRDITWFPFEMWCAGLPYLETGDELEISIGETTYTSYVLQRQLKGIQNLQDTYINGTLDIF